MCECTGVLGALCECESESCAYVILCVCGSCCFLVFV